MEVKVSVETALRWPARTRARETRRTALLRAALEAARTSGYRRASLDAIAEDAGVTKGAIYSIFGSKRALFAQALEGVIGLPDLSGVARRGAPLVDVLRAYGRLWGGLASSHEARVLRTAALEWHLEALASAELTAAYVPEYEAATERFARDLARRADAAGEVLRVPAGDLAVMVLAALQGLVQRSFLVPVPASLFEDTAAAFAVYAAHRAQA